MKVELFASEPNTRGTTIPFFSQTVFFVGALYCISHTRYGYYSNSSDSPFDVGAASGAKSEYGWDLGGRLTCIVIFG